MFKLDHLMVEVDNPQQAANDVVEMLGLPLAWPLIEKDDYTSIGVNFGDLNIEFIRFNVRFGIRDTKFSGFSGAAFAVQGSVEKTKSILEEKGLNYRVGEETEAHTTITIEENRTFPTVFLVKYNFDTSGWKNRLREEFESCQGGVHKIDCLKSLEFNQKGAEMVLNEFNIKRSALNRIKFKSRLNKTIVIRDLIDNLEVVIA